MARDGSPSVPDAKGTFPPDIASAVLSDREDMRP